MNESKEIYNLIVDKGKEFNLSHCGMFAMDTMRMEKGYLHWGHDMSPEENQYEAGLKFAVSFKKNASPRGGDPAVVDQRHVDPRPIDVLRRQQGQHFFRGATAGKRQGRACFLIERFDDRRTKGIGKSDRAGLGIGKIETVQRFQRRTPGGISMCRHIPLRSAISPLSVTCAPSTSAVNSQ